MRTLTTAIALLLIASSCTERPTQGASGIDVTTRSSARSDAPNALVGGPATGNFYGDANQTWTVTALPQGEVRLAVAPDDFDKADLAGVAMEADLYAGNSPLVLRGSVVQGQILQGIVTFVAATAIAEPLVVQGTDKNEFTILKGTASVAVQDNQFVKATLNATADVSIGIGESVLQTTGNVSGQYNPDGTVSIAGALSLAKPFAYSMDKMAVRLNSGTAEIRIDQSEFRSARFDLEAETDISAGENGPLVLEGTLTGQYTPDRGFTFTGTLSIAKDFVYETADVKATLSSGGTVTVKVDSSQFETARLEGVQADIRIATRNGALELEGLVSGKYRTDDGLSVRGALELSADFLYVKDDVTVTLTRGGALAVKVEDNAFTMARFDGIAARAEVVIGGQTLELEGNVSGKVEPESGPTIAGLMSMVKPFSFSGAGTTITAAAGPIGVVVREGELKAIRLDGLEVRVAIARNGETIVTEGTVDRGRYVDGRVVIQSQDLKAAGLRGAIRLDTTEDSDDDGSGDEPPDRRTDL